MRRLATLASILVLLPLLLWAAEEEPTTYAEAKALAVQKHRPLLLEFFRDDCLYCALAHAEADTNKTLIEALKAVVHFPLDALDSEGQTLAEKYRVGPDFPVFILTNSKGEVFARWTGYTTAARFIASLKDGLEETITIEERAARYKIKRASDDARVLAEYYGETQEWLLSLQYWRDLHGLSRQSGADYSYEILKTAANACWNDLMPFDSVLMLADTVLAQMNKSEVVMARTTTLLINLARKKDKTDVLRKYIRAGLTAIEKSTNPYVKDYYINFQVDWALYVEADTAKAIAIKKRSLPAGWDNDPTEFYQFAKYCLERKMNLEEAESHARRAAQRVRSGPTAAGVYSTLANICLELGKLDEAVSFAEEAVIQGLSSEGYKKQLDEFTAARDKAKQ